MKNLKKNLALIAGGVLLSALVIANSVGVFAAEAPAQPDPTECTECDAIQTNLDNAYTDLAILQGSAGNFSAMAEGLLEQATTTIYAGDPLMTADLLNSEVSAGHLASGVACEDPNDTFAYYSSFAFEGTTYCVLDEDMWYGIDPDYFNFFLHMIELNEIWDPPSAVDWQLLWDEWIETILDHDAGGEMGLTEVIDLINSLLADLQDCEDLNCPEVVVCPDCETIALDLEFALDDLALLEIEADLLDLELTAIETEIDTVLDQLLELATIKAEFEAMVEDAGGQHGEDCDDFQVGSGQAWGIAHNFADTQWCFTDEGQIEDMLQNLDEYWQAHSSTHLPSETALNEQLDTLMLDYFAALADLKDVLADIAAQHVLIDELMVDLADCLAELQALQDLGECLDQDIAAMQAVLDEAAGVEPFTPAPPTEEPPAEEPADEPVDAPGDILDHWAEDFITNLFAAGIVSGDGDTGDFRPNDNLNRAEAAKMLILANEDPLVDSFFDVFFDVTEDDWFWTFVNTSSDLGYFEGYADGSFGPANSILRAEAITVVMRALGFEVPEYTEYSFPDLSGDEWFADFAEKAFQCGIVTGRDGDFVGGDTITRAEMSKIVDVALLGDLDEWECADYTGCPECEAGDTECEEALADLQAVDACLPV